MEMLDLARRFLELGETAKAQEAYFLVAQSLEAMPEEKYEAAYFILQSGGDYKTSYTIFVNLYNEGHFEEDIFDILVASFYAPNNDKLKKLYHKNITKLKKYKYIFTKDFPSFDELKIKFFPYDDQGYLPFYIEENRFGEYTRYVEDKEKCFFSDLSKALKYEDVYSSFDLEYLYDNVRKSEWVAYDNHIYLWYSSFSQFASHLQVLDFGNILSDEKFVFLFEKEISYYPIDFKKDYDIDYETMNVKHLSISEIKRLIWHAQTSSHTGGDFFNEVFDNHPNIMMIHSVMLDTQETMLDTFKDALIKASPTGRLSSLGQLIVHSDLYDTDSFEKAMLNKKINYENIFIASYISSFIKHGGSPKERIVPAVFFQPHFGNLDDLITRVNEKYAIAQIKDNEDLEKIGYVNQFKYVRTFAPYRRFTTRAAASYKFAYTFAYDKDLNPTDEESPSSLAIQLFCSLLNKSLYVNKDSYLFGHSKAVRFEDAKINPKATFSSLCKFLDLPYTQSMTYCSLFGEADPESFLGNVIGFSTDAVYRTYDEYIEDNERYLIEYLMKKEMNHLGYEFCCYDQKEYSLEEVIKLASKNFRVYDFQKKLIENHVHSQDKYIDKDTEIAGFIASFAMSTNKHLTDAITVQYGEPIYISKEGKLLDLMELITLDPSLLEADVYK